jgi:sRNA-binding protein
MTERCSKLTANATIAALADLFPAAFSRERWQPHKPRKIGVDQDLIAYQYLLALARGGPRFDLNGQPCGEVSPEQQAAASIAAAHVEALAENQFRDALAQYRKARAKPQARPPNGVRPREIAPAPTPPPASTGQGLTLADLRRLAQERKAGKTATTACEQGAIS